MKKRLIFEVEGYDDEVNDTIERLWDYATEDMHYDMSHEKDDKCSTAWIDSDTEIKVIGWIE